PKYTTGSGARRRLWPPAATRMPAGNENNGPRCCAGRSWTSRRVRFCTAEPKQKRLLHALTPEVPHVSAPRREPVHAVERDSPSPLLVSLLLVRPAEDIRHVARLGVASPPPSTA